MNYRDLHIELWDWLINNPGKEKSHWPRWEENGGDIPGVSCDCFACQHDDDYGSASCGNCPIVWPGGGDCMKMDNGRKGVFLLWEESKNMRARKRLAELIRDLPWEE